MSHKINSFKPIFQGPSQPSAKDSPNSTVAVALPRLSAQQVTKMDALQTSNVTVISKLHSLDTFYKVLIVLNIVVFIALTILTFGFSLIPLPLYVVLLTNIAFLDGVSPLIRALFSSPSENALDGQYTPSVPDNWNDPMHFPSPGERGPLNANQQQLQNLLQLLANSPSKEDTIQYRQQVYDLLNSGLYGPIATDAAYMQNANRTGYSLPTDSNWAPASKYPTNSWANALAEDMQTPHNIEKTGIYTAQWPYNIYTTKAGITACAPAYFSNANNVIMAGNATNGITFGAAEGFNGASVAETGNMSVDLQMKNNNNSVTYSVVQGSPYMTGNFQNLTPQFTISGGIILSLTVDGQTLTRDDLTSGKPIPVGSTYTYTMNNNTTWKIYAAQPMQLGFNSVSNVDQLTAASPFTGYVRVACVPPNPDYVPDSQAPKYASILDQYSGVIPSKATCSTDNPGYAFAYTSVDLSGILTDQDPLILLKYHTQAKLAIDPTQEGAPLQPGLTCETVQGPMRAVVGSFLRFLDNPPTDFNYIPSSVALSVSDAQALQASALSGIQDSMASLQTLQFPSSTYSTGKLFQKAGLTLQYAQYLNSISTSTDLQNAMQALAALLKGQMQIGLQKDLVWDNTWKGIVATDTQGGSNPTGNDFGNGIYNDHQFHYGYWINAANLLTLWDNEFMPSDRFIDSSVDPSQPGAPPVKKMINDLVRDVGNPSSNDPEIIQNRQMSFFCGHNNNGLATMGDGKDQESTSEDFNFSLAIANWGKLTENQDLEKHGAQLLAMSVTAAKTYWQIPDPNNGVYRGTFAQSNLTVDNVFDQKVTQANWFDPSTGSQLGIQAIPDTLPSMTSLHDPKYAANVSQYVLPNINNEQIFDGGWKSYGVSMISEVDPTAAAPLIPQLQPTDIDPGTNAFILSFNNVVLSKMSAKNGSGSKEILKFPDQTDELTEGVVEDTSRPALRTDYVAMREFAAM